MTWLDFCVLALAAMGLHNVWFEGSIFAPLRQTFEDILYAADEPMSSASVSVDDHERLPRSLWVRLLHRFCPLWFAELVTCPYCASHHTPWIVGVAFFLPRFWVTQPGLEFLIQLPAWTLAAAQLHTMWREGRPDDNRRPFTDL